MKKLFPIALIALTAALGAGCKKEVQEPIKETTSSKSKQAALHSQSIASLTVCECSECQPKQNWPPKK